MPLLGDVFELCLSSILDALIASNDYSFSEKDVAETNNIGFFPMAVSRYNPPSKIRPFDNFEAKFDLFRERKRDALFKNDVNTFTKANNIDADWELFKYQQTCLKKLNSALRKPNVVGLEDEENAILNYLMDRKKEIDVISITGMYGLGKTTLAKKIFENQKMVCEFSTRIWINVSQNLQIRNVYLDILRMFTSHDMSSLSDEELRENVRACLVKQKFLLVLDDVWSTEHWEKLKEILPEHNGMAKVIITTRNEDVAALASDKRMPHKMRFLSRDESWKLLQLEVFGNLDDCPSKLEGIRKSILSHCDGLPLLVKVLGGILAGQLNAPDSIQMEWLKVTEMFLNTKRSISDMIELSYHGLPPDLRECFLYMGVFPKDYEMPASELTHLWIAEGFIKPKDYESLEETAFRNLNDLIGRNLVMVDKINPIGEVKKCRIHDMIRAFCIQKAEEHALFQHIAISEKEVLKSPESNELRTALRIGAQLCVNALLAEERANVQQVRSLLCFHDSPEGWNEKYISFILNDLKLLRVLESKSIQFHEIPQEITKLFHLKYITLSVGDLSILPKSLAKLWNLQTLLVHTTSSCIIMEANIWKMIRLRHFKTNAAIVLSSKGKGAAGAGENLQTVNSLSPESCTADFSKRARNLKELGIKGDVTPVIKTKFLKRFDHIEKLKLAHNNISICDLPLHFSFPKTLKWLTLSNTFLKWKHMSFLAEINTLEVLKLKDNAITGIYWKATDYCFVSLKFLLIAKTDLVLWEASTNSFPTLKSLVLKNCVNLNEIPEALAETLEKLDIENLGKSALYSAMKIASIKKCSELELSIGPGCFL